MLREGLGSGKLYHIPDVFETPCVGGFFLFLCFFCTTAISRSLGAHVMLHRAGSAFRVAVVLLGVSYYSGQIFNNRRGRRVPRRAN